jgi:hypothetical protein
MPPPLSVHSNQMASAHSKTNSYERPPARKNARKRRLSVRRQAPSPASVAGAILFVVAGSLMVYWAFQIHAHYTFSLQSPVQMRLHWPLVVAHRMSSEDAYQAQLDQHRALTAYQEYTCLKFGPACRVALAIQRAENPEGKCETYHYNADGTLDWGYFQINTVHLKRAGLNLRDLLDCRANIDFAYQLYSERASFSAWSAYNSGAYRKYLRR